jgi:hypothetical protein
VSFGSQLRAELARNGMRGKLADRIVAEFEDHLACDPEAHVGAPAEIAERFAVELRIVRTRRASVGVFAALAFCALLLGLATGSQSAGGATTRSALSGLGILAFTQIAFVAGVLALSRGLRGRGAGDFRLAQRRGLVALAAGAGVCACLAAHGAFVEALVPLPGLAAAAWAQRSALAITPKASADGLAADLPVSPLLALAALAVAAVGLVVLEGIVGERSLSEGLTRGAIEAGGLALGVALLGRPLGLLSSAR